MGTSLSFHKTYIRSTHRLLVIVLTSVFILQSMQQTFCAVIPDSSDNSLIESDSTRHIRHSGSRRNLRNMFNQDSDRTNSSSASSQNSADSDSYFGVFSIKSPCSDKYVRIISDEVTALNDQAARIEFEKIIGTENQFYIRRVNSRKFVCISRRGKLIVRKQPSNDHRCAFTRIPTDPTSQLSQSNNLLVKIQSVAQNSWYIGFKNNGYPMKAWQYSVKGDKCFRLEIQKYPPTEDSLVDRQSLTNSLHKRHTEQSDSQLDTR